MILVSGSDVFVWHEVEDWQIRLESVSNLMRLEGELLGMNDLELTRDKVRDLCASHSEHSALHRVMCDTLDGIIREMRENVKEGVRADA